MNISTQTHNQDEQIPAFRDHWDYMEARLIELKMLLLYHGARLVRRLEQPSGFTLQGAEQQLILGVQISAWPEQWELSDEAFAALEHEVEELRHEIEAQTRQTLQEGIPLPFETLIDTHQLTRFEQRAILLAFAFSLDSSYQYLHRIFHPRFIQETLFAPSFQMAAQLLTADRIGYFDALSQLASNAKLFSEKLLTVHGNPSLWGGASSFEQQLFTLGEKTLLQLTDTAHTVQASESWLNVHLQPAFARVNKATEQRLSELSSHFLVEHGPSKQVTDEEGHTCTKYQPFLADGLCLVWQHMNEDIALENTRQFCKGAQQELHCEDASKWLEQTEPSKAIRAVFEDVAMRRVGLFLTRLSDWLNNADTSSITCFSECLNAHSRLVFVCCQGLPEPILSGKHALFVCKGQSVDTGFQSGCSQITGSSIFSQHSESKKVLSELLDYMCARIIGQKAALRRMVDALQVSKVGLSIQPSRPDGVFLLVGPSGVGKTETAKVLNRALHGAQRKLVRLDMSEFYAKESISSLIGTTPGYIGFNQGGTLTNALKSFPDSIVLLDEMEKAHPQILDVFLQIFDDGRLTSGQGETIDASQATFLITSNIGAEIFEKSERLGFVKERTDQEYTVHIRHALRKQLRPEFLNRMDDILVFTPLKEEHLADISAQALYTLQMRCAKRGIWLQITSDVYTYFAQKAPERGGARGLQRVIEREVARPLATLWIRQKLPSIVRVAVQDDVICVTPCKDDVLGCV